MLFFKKIELHFCYYFNIIICEYISYYLKNCIFWGTQDNDTEIKMSFRAVISFHYYLLSGLHGTQELYMDQDPF